MELNNPFPFQKREYPRTGTGMERKISLTKLSFFLVSRPLFTATINNEMTRSQHNYLKLNKILKILEV